MDAADAPTPDASAAPREERPLTVLLLGGLAFVLPLAFSPTVTAPGWTPKYCLLLALLPLGLLALVRLRQGRSAQVGALVIVAIALATAVSHAPRAALVGPYGGGTSAVLLASIVGCWALGRHLPEDHAPFVERALLAGVLVSCVVAVLQRLFDLSALGLALYDGRSAAFLGNPVHFATLTAAGVPLALAQHRRARRSELTVGAAVLLGTAAQVSGSRFLLLGIVAGGVYLLVRSRALATVLFVGGLAVGCVVGGFVTSGPGREGASNRIVSVGLAEGSTRQRLYTWQEALHTIGDRPLLGFGPGRYLQATLPHRSLALAKAGTDSYFEDAHNIVVNIVIDLGLLGAAAFAAWFLLALRQAHGPLLWAALVIVAMQLVEPVHPGTTPLIGLALGAAAGSPPSRPRRRSGPLTASVAAAAVGGLVLGAFVLVGDIQFQNARLSGDRVATASAARRLPPWPEVSDATARVIVYDAVVQRDNSLLLEGARWERRAVAFDRRDPRWWLLAGLVEAKAGRQAEASASLREVLRLNPYSCGAWSALRRMDQPVPTDDARIGSLCRP